MDNIYAFVAFVRDSRWDSQDDNYFYKTYDFWAIPKTALKFFEDFLACPDKQKISPRSFLRSKDLSNVETLAKGIAEFYSKFQVKFDRKTSEVSEEMKDLYFFY